MIMQKIGIESDKKREKRIKNINKKTITRRNMGIREEEHVTDGDTLIKSRRQGSREGWRHREVRRMKRKAW